MVQDFETAGVQALAAEHCQPEVNRVNAIHQPGEKPDEFAIVDVMGHQQFIGRLSEQVVAGTAFVRIDTLNADFTVKETRLIGAASIYMIRPLSLEKFMFEIAPAKQPAMLVDRRERYQDDADGPF